MLSLLVSLLLVASCSRPSANGSSDVEQYLDSLFAAAQETYYGGGYDSARIAFETMRVTALQHSLPGAEASASTWLGLAAWRLGDYGEARRLGEEALALKLDHDLEGQLFRSYNALGLLAWNENRLSDASELLGNALDVAESTGVKRDVAAAAGNLALVHTELGRFNEARAGFQTMLALAQEAGETRTVGNALTNLGMLEIRVGAPQAALPLLEEARVRYDSLGYATGVLSALGQIGTAYTALGEPQAAFSALDQALAMARAQGLRQEEASNLEALAELYREAGDFQRALSLYEEAKSINHELGLDVETGADLRGEAAIRVRLGDLLEAHALAAEAENIHRLAGARLDRLLDLLLLAEIQDLMQAGAARRASLYTARRLAEELDARIARTELALTEARIAERNGDFGEILSATGDMGQDLSRGSFSSEWEAHLLRSKAFAGLGMPDPALAEGENALEAVERVRRGFGSGLLRTAYLSDRQEVYSHLVSLLLARGLVSEAFAVSDAARGRTFRQGISTARGRFPNGQPWEGQYSAADARSGRMATEATLLEGEAVLLEIDQLVLSIDYLEGFPREERTRSQFSELARLYAQVDSLRARHGELTVRASEIDAAQAVLLGTGKTRSDAIQKVLLPGQVLVEYLATSTGSVEGFVLTPSDIHHFQAPISGQNLSTRVRLARELITRGQAAQEETRRVLSGLHEVLLGGFMDSGLVEPGNELLFVPHGALSHLPFAALYDRKAGKYLAETHLTRILPSAGTLNALRASGDQGSGLLEKASVLAPFPDHLPATVAEAEAVARGIPGIQSYLGAAATEARLRRALGSRQVVHIATHGVLNAHNPLFSRLELRPGDRNGSDDGRLEVHELFNLSVASPLVFLSGCETAAGPSGTTGFERGEDLATLALAFLYAGARNVIATLWPVEDEGAARFAEAFYRGVGDGSLSLALASAQRALLNTEEFREPYHWAAYQLVGDGLDTLPAHKARAESVQHP